MACFECGEVDVSPCTPSQPVEPIKYNKCNTCKPISCKQKLDSRCVIYKWNQNNCSEGLPYLDLENSTSIEDVIEKIDDTFIKLDRPTLINCFATQSSINAQSYNLNDVLLKLQEGYCNQIALNVSTVQSILEIVRDTPSLKALFCEIVGAC